MEPIVRTTKSEERFNKMRTITLGDRNKRHNITGYFGQRNKDYVSWGFNSKLITTYIDPYLTKYHKDNPKKDLILVDDFTFILTNYCISNFNPDSITVIFIVENAKDRQNIQDWIDDYFKGTEQLKIIYLMKEQVCYPKLTKQGNPLINKATGEHKYDIKERWNIKELKQMKHIDLIISNGPYGKIGADITEVLRDNIDYIDFINLLPANNYTLNKGKDLFKYTKNMEAVNNAFDGDATVTTHITDLISKDEKSNITLAEFIILQCIDPNLFKYFTENSKRTLAIAYKDLSGKKPNTWLVNRTLLVGWRDVANGHFPYDKNIESYLWNKQETIDKAKFIEEKNRTRARIKGSFELCYFTYTFNTAEEKHNICNFIYSDKGFKFMSKVFTAENSDGNKEIFVDMALPKVDWTRAWSVEEILADYGYSQDEIKEVMDDLNSVDANGNSKYKGMDD